MAVTRAALIALCHHLDAAAAVARAMLAAEGGAEAEPFDMVEAVRVACHEAGISILTGGYIREADAAVLLDRSPATLRNWRREHQPLAFRRRAGRPVYALEVLAKYLAEQTTSDPD